MSALNLSAEFDPGGDRLGDLRDLCGDLCLGEGDLLDLRDLRTSGDLECLLLDPIGDLDLLEPGEDLWEDPDGDLPPRLGLGEGLNEILDSLFSGLLDLLLVLLEGGGLGLELYLSLEDLSFEVFDDLECLEALSVDLEREDL